MHVNSTLERIILVTGGTTWVCGGVILGSLISKDSRVSEDIKESLGDIWRSKQYSLKTKTLVNSHDKSVLQVGLRELASGMRLEVSHNGCLQRICQICRPNEISNNELYKKTKSWSITIDITHRRLRWLWQVLRMEQSSIPKVALSWTPPDKRKPGRPKNTWHIIVTQELEQMNLLWPEVQHTAEDQSNWKHSLKLSFPLETKRSKSVSKSILSCLDVCCGQKESLFPCHFMQDTAEWWASKKLFLVAKYRQRNYIAKAVHLVIGSKTTRHLFLFIHRSSHRSLGNMCTWTMQACMRTECSLLLWCAQQMALWSYHEIHHHREDHRSIRRHVQHIWISYTALLWQWTSTSFKWHECSLAR